MHCYSSSSQTCSSFGYGIQEDKTKIRGKGTGVGFIKQRTEEASDAENQSSPSAPLADKDIERGHDEVVQLPNKCCYISHEHREKLNRVEEVYESNENSSLLLSSRIAATGKEKDECSKKQQNLKQSVKVKLAINLTFWMNVVLFCLKTGAAFHSFSLSVIASTVDSFLDLLSGFVLFVASWFISGRNSGFNFPGGTSRIEPLAVLIFAVAMFTGSVKELYALSQNSCFSNTSSLSLNTATTQLIVESVDALINGGSEKTIDMVPISILGFTVVVKIVLWAICHAIDSSESVRVTTAVHHLPRLPLIDSI